MTFERAIELANFLVADSSTHARKLTRSMLHNMGARNIHEVTDGVAALDAVTRVSADVMIINWEMPSLHGHEVVRKVRVPGEFPKPDLPIIVLTEVGTQSRIVEAFWIGAHDVLLKPFSPKALEQRLRGILLTPRPMIRKDGRYFPAPHTKANMGQLAEAM